MGRMAHEDRGPHTGSHRPVHLDRTHTGRPGPAAGRPGPGSAPPPGRARLTHPAGRAGAIPAPYIAIERRGGPPPARAPLTDAEIEQVALDALGPGYPLLLAGWRAAVTLARLAAAGIAAAVAFVFVLTGWAEVVGGQGDPAVVAGCVSGFIAAGLASWWLAGGRPD